MFDLDQLILALAIFYKIVNLLYLLNLLISFVGNHDGPPTTPTDSLAVTPASASKCLDTFPIFSTLPIELRLKIWRMSFISQDVDFGVCVTRSRPGHGSAWKYCFVAQLIFPVTLRVNKESRLETLNHYGYLFSDVTFSDHRAPENSTRMLPISLRPILVNPKIDFALLQFPTNKVASRMLEYAETCISDGIMGIGLQGFRKLKLVDLDYSVDFVHSNAWSDAPKTLGIEPPVPESTKDILKFTHLEELHIAVKTEYLPGLTERKGEIEIECRDIVKRYLENHRETFAAERLPNIFIQLDYYDI